MHSSLVQRNFGRKLSLSTTRVIGHAKAFDIILWVVVPLRLVLARPFLKLRTQLDMNGDSTTPKRDWRAPYRLSVTSCLCINGLAI